MKRVHYIDNYLIDPQHPVTVNLIGAGGTGSQVLTCLARLDVTLRALGHPGLSVTLYDPDIVSGTNIGRQLFSDSDIGLNKAKCLITRVNNFFGNDWKAEPRPYPSVLKSRTSPSPARTTSSPGSTCGTCWERCRRPPTRTMPRHSTGWTSATRKRPDRL